MDSHCCQTLRRNRPDWPLLEGPIADFSSEQILQTAGLRRGEAALVAGGPPCQPFSKSSYWSTGDTRRLNDPRADTLAAFMRVVRDVLPQTFLLENVYGLLYKGKDEGLRHLLELTAQVNKETGARYTVFWKVLNAAEHGLKAAVVRDLAQCEFLRARRTSSSPAALAPGKPTWRGPSAWRP